MFEFVFKGFDALGYEEHLDYDLVQSSNPAFNKAIVRVNIFRQHRQTIQYIQPQDAHMLGQAELLVIDEAAAIPLPLVKKLLGNYLVFMARSVCMCVCLCVCVCACVRACVRACACFCARSRLACPRYFKSFALGLARTAGRS